MKIEKITDNQIRCTLTKSDLADRQLKLSELAYGTEKAKDLFRDMMEQASYEFGFEAEDIPLMIEAIPLSSETVILIITKVEYPEELDTRFSKFSPSFEEELEESINLTEDKASRLLDFINEEVTDKPIKNFVPLGDALNSVNEPEEIIDDEPAINIPKDEKTTAPKREVINNCFIFNDFDSALTAAASVSAFCNAESILFKDKKNDNYIISVNGLSVSPEDYNRLGNVFSEYGQSRRCTDASLAYLYEHHEVIIEKDAIKTMAEILN